MKAQVRAVSICGALALAPAFLGANTIDRAGRGLPGAVAPGAANDSSSLAAEAGGLAFELLDLLTLTQARSASQNGYARDEVATEGVLSPLSQRAVLPQAGAPIRETSETLAAFGDPLSSPAGISGLSQGSGHQNVLISSNELTGAWRATQSLANAGVDRPPFGASSIFSNDSHNSGNNLLESDGLHGPFEQAVEFGSGSPPPTPTSNLLSFSDPVVASVAATVATPEPNQLGLLVLAAIAIIWAFQRRSQHTKVIR